MCYTERPVVRFARHGSSLILETFSGAGLRLGGGTDRFCWMPASSLRLVGVQASKEAIVLDTCDDLVSSKLISREATHSPKKSASNNSMAACCATGPDR